MLKADSDALARGFSAMFNACAESGGPRTCSCHSNAEWTISNPAESLTDTFFCLPSECFCNNGQRQKLRLWVN